MSSPLALSPSATLSLDHFGSEAQPILTVGNALSDADAVIDIASRHSYRPMGPFYPGIRAGVSEKIAMPLVEPLADRLVESFGLARPPRYRECFLSLVTRRAQELSPIQRLPHFDGVEPTRLAVLLYLDRAERGGTAFYRQRATGYESVDADRFERYRSELDREAAEKGVPESGYISGDTPLFQQVHAVAGRFNSMVVYRGNTLHCAQLAAGFSPGATPADGRLTLNLFLD